MVGETMGCLPQTHHVILPRLRGTEEPENLKTLCYPCHSTKPSPGHRKLLDEVDPNRVPDYVKSLLWDLSLNLMAYAEWRIDPRRFAAKQVVEDLETWRKWLETIIGLAQRVKEDNPSCVAHYQPLRPAVTPTRGELEALLEGVRVGLYAHERQQRLDTNVSGGGDLEVGQ